QATRQPVVRPRPVPGERRQARPKADDRKLERRNRKASSRKSAEAGAGKQRNRNDAHDTLSILDESPLATEEENGLDPYNTGRFDRSKNWDKSFRS
ncbi:MAG TPA: hypothetical protein PKK10_03575, partial [Woeseiaceae bacterium]|nr:hypothetical protein [Woeseiaceae bacterium]